MIRSIKAKAHFTTKSNLKFKLSENKTKLILNDNCITAYAKDDIDMIRLKDRLIYGLFDIIE